MNDLRSVEKLDCSGDCRTVRMNRESHEELHTMTLFDFLYRWLPGMSGDGVMAGPNWTGELVGKEIDPYDLRVDIEGRMPPRMAAEYEGRYLELTGQR